MDQFSSGPGSNKVRAGEYLLYNSLDTREDLQKVYGQLPPGLSITMSIVLGRYAWSGQGKLDCCLRIGCMSNRIVDSECGGRFWLVLCNCLDTTKLKSTL